MSDLEKINAVKLKYYSIPTRTIFLSISLFTLTLSCSRIAGFILLTRDGATGWFTISIDSNKIWATVAFWLDFVAVLIWATGQNSANVETALMTSQKITFKNYELIKAYNLKLRITGIRNSVRQGQISKYSNFEGNRVTLRRNVLFLHESSRNFKNHSLLFESYSFVISFI